MEKIKLRGNIISALSLILVTRGKLEQHNILLEWIKQQCREIIGGRTNMQKEGGQGQSKGPSLRVL